jgi:hypothetical protein
MKLVSFLLCSVAAIGQDFTQQGYVEMRLFGFPQTAADDSGHVVGEANFHYDLSYKLAPWITFSGGIDAQTDTHDETARTFSLDILNRGLERPPFEIQTANFTIHKEHLTLVLGKQFIRWGKADILNPTDRFSPRDYLNVTESQLLGIVAARATIEARNTSLDLIWEPVFTPSRMPLLNQRWTVLPDNLPGNVENAATHYPGGAQYGARLNHTSSRYEVSASYFEGFNTFPLIGTTFAPAPPSLYVQRVYPKIRMYGADSAIPLPWFTIKTEGAYFQSTSSSDGLRSDNYFLWVAQLERQVGDWTFIGGYSGQTVTRYGGAVDFDPERGLSRAILARVAYAIDARRNIAFETATRQNGAGTWTRIEYSQLLGSHWRATAEIAYIGGSSMIDFLGQYHRNSYSALKIRYSF